MNQNELNIFEKYTDKELLIGGILITVAGSLLGYFFNGRFDGFFELHFVEKVNWYQPLSDNLLNIAVGTLFLFLLGKLVINPKTRFLDMLNAVMVSRLLLYALTLFNAGNFISNITNKMMDDLQEIKIDFNLIFILVFGFFTLFVLVAFVFVLFMGFKVGTNSKKQIHILYFLITIVLTEIVSKIIFLI